MHTLIQQAGVGSESLQFQHALGVPVIFMVHEPGFECSEQDSTKHYGSLNNV